MWEAVNRLRFKKRVQDAAKILEPVLLKRLNPKKILFIDIQGFNVPEFTPKELSLTYDGKMILAYLFKPPKPFNELTNDCKKQALWLERHHHGIRYTSGYEDLKNLTKIFSKMAADVVYVKGSQKAEYLRNYYDNVIDLTDDDECPNLSRSLNCCHLHKNRLSICSFINVEKLCRYVRIKL